MYNKIRIMSKSIMIEHPSFMAPLGKGASGHQENSLNAYRSDVMEKR